MRAYEQYWLTHGCYIQSEAVKDEPPPQAPEQVHNSGSIYFPLLLYSPSRVCRNPTDTIRPEYTGHAWTAADSDIISIHQRSCAANEHFDGESVRSSSAFVANSNLPSIAIDNVVTCSCSYPPISYPNNPPALDRTKLPPPLEVGDGMLPSMLPIHNLSGDFNDRGFGSGQRQSLPAATRGSMAPQVVRARDKCLAMVMVSQCSAC